MKKEKSSLEVIIAEIAKGVQKTGLWRPLRGHENFSDCRAVSKRGQSL